MAIDCTDLALADIDYVCADITAPVGSDRDLMITPYANFDRANTLTIANRETDDTNKNEDGLSDIFVVAAVAGTDIFTFTGTDYSVVPTVTSEVKEDGNSWFIHSLLFTAYSKTAKTRKVIEALAGERVIAIAKERSTGLYEVFGTDQGLTLNALERAYVGAQNSNFYQVTIASPDIAVIRESTTGELSVNPPSVFA